jgi:uncharacterized protein YprB with RNaseH-like and TPR domain
LLRQSFAHIPGIGPATELRLWEAGFDDWDVLLSNLEKAPIGSADRETVRKHLLSGIKALATGKPAYFKKTLGVKDAWRAFPEFRDACVYLDIETDGGQAPNAITVIGLFDGHEYYGLLKGKDLESFPELMARFKMVVTFYGAGFDLPMLQKRFKDEKFDQVHLDLCPTLKRIGYQGGLKRIERTLGIERSPQTQGLTGYDAVKLWNRYYHLDDERALNLLVDYNREDVVNLERLAVHAYDRLRVQTLMASPESVIAETSTEAPKSGEAAAN